MNIEADSRLDWFRKARFGMFIHWGPVSLAGTEIGWSRGDSVDIPTYDSLYKKFDPLDFDAQEWMALAKEAGMRYIVPTAKHHDGFCLWPTKSSSYNISATPFKRDIMGELSAAARANGLAMCSYYSILDWKSPDYGTGSPGGRGQKESPNMDRHMSLVESQVTELVEKYRLKMIWFDGQWESPYTREHSVHLNNLLRSRFPKLIINDRINSNGLHTDDPRGDYRTPEQQVGAYDTEHPWETCMTLGNQWSFSPTDKYKSKNDVLRILLQTVTGDGNLLLNVGPEPSGQIPAQQKAILKSVGEWLKEYGTSVYNTRGGPYKNGQWGGTTRRGKTIFFHVLDWGKGTIDLPGLPAKIKSVRTLQKDRQVAVSWTPNSVQLRIDGPIPTGPTTVRVDIDTDAWSLGTIQ